MFANAHTHTRLSQRNIRKIDGPYGPRCGPHAVHYDINRVMLSRSQIKLNLFNLLTTKDFKITMRDDKGNEVTDPQEALVFGFEYKVGDNSYGTVVISITPEDSLEVYYGDSVGKAMEVGDKEDWFDFLYQLRHFARKSMLNFDLKDMSKLQQSMQSMAALSESKYYGSKKTSYTRSAGPTKLKIVHNKPVGEYGASKKRYTNIKNLYVETSDGSRFKLPFKQLWAGHAMARHIAEGGNPYDTVGTFITDSVHTCGVLAGFIRATSSKELSEEAQQMTTDAIRHYGKLKRKVKSMMKKKFYDAVVKEIKDNPQPELQDLTDSIKDMFTERVIDTRVQDAVNILNKIKQENSVMDETQEFKSWADKVVEGYDEDTVRELEIMADNDALLYKQSFIPIVKNLLRKKMKGVYDHDLAKKLWKYHMDRTNKQFSLGATPDDRREAASRLADRQEFEMDQGNYSNLNLKRGALEVKDLLADADLSLGMNKYGIYTMKHKDKYFAFQRDKKIGGPFDDLKDVEDFYKKYLPEAELVERKVYYKDDGSPAYIVMTYREFQRTNPDFKGKVDGQRMATVLNPVTQGTELVPVRLVKDFREAQARVDKVANTPKTHQQRIAMDVVKNPSRAHYAGLDQQEAVDILRNKFDFTQRQIQSLLNQ